MDELAAPCSDRLWTGALWIRLGAASTMLAMLVLEAQPLAPAPVSDLVRAGVQCLFAHGMATIACATFMNAEAARAVHAPALFLTGATVFAGALFAAALRQEQPEAIIVIAGMALMTAGWLVLIAAGAQIDSLKH